MKNAISYYYNLIPTNIHLNGNVYKFESQDTHYILMPTDRTLDELNDLYSVSISLINSNVFVHEMIFNVNKSLATFINDKLYVLLKILINDNTFVSINDIILFNKVQIYENYKIVSRDNWYDLWVNKIDYFEYQIGQIGKEYKNIRNSFSYFVGLAENAIMLVKDIKVQELTVAHKRVRENYTLIDLYNPLNFVLDSKVRDIAEYFKSNYREPNILNEMKNYFAYSNLSNDEVILFFARILFPSEYFDIYEKVLEIEKNDKDIEKMIVYINRYEIFLKDVYFYIKNNYYIPSINWLEKKHLN